MRKYFKHVSFGLLFCLSFNFLGQKAFAEEAVKQGLAKSIINHFSSSFNLAVIKSSEAISGPTHTQGPYRDLYQEMFDDERGIKFDDFPPGTKELFKAIIPEYLKHRLAEHYNLAELVHFKHKFEEELKPVKPDGQSKTPAELEASKQKALEMIIYEFDPFTQKIFQALKSKQKDNYLSKAITTVQSGLPPLSDDEVYAALKKDYPIEVQEGRLKINHSKGKNGVAGVGTIGQVNFITYQDTDGVTHNMVAKIIKPNAVKDIEDGAKTLADAISKVELDENVPLSVRGGAHMIKEFITKVKKGILEETEPQKEIGNVEKFKKLYTTRRVVTVELADMTKSSKAANRTQHVILLKEASGVVLGKRLEELQSKPRLNAEEVQEIADIKAAFSEFLGSHNKNILENELVHTDPHTGNLMWDNSKKVLTILDAGAAARPAADAESHKRSLSFVLHMYLAMATMEPKHILLYYKNFVDEQKVSAEVRKELGQELQKALSSLDLSASITEKRKAIIKTLGMMAKKTNTPELFPDGLMAVARAQTLLSDLFSSLSDALEGTDHLRSVSILKRTDTAISLQALADYNFQMLLPWSDDTLWTKDSRDLLIQQVLSNPKHLSKLLADFTKNTFDLSDDEVSTLKELTVVGSAGAATLILNKMLGKKAATLSAPKQPKPVIEVAPDFCPGEADPRSRINKQAADRSFNELMEQIAHKADPSLQKKEDVFKSFEKMTKQGDRMRDRQFEREQARFEQQQERVRLQQAKMNPEPRILRPIHSSQPASARIEAKTVRPAVRDQVPQDKISQLKTAAETMISRANKSAMRTVFRSAPVPVKAAAVVGAACVGAVCASQNAN